MNYGKNFINAFNKASSVVSDAKNKATDLGKEIAKQAKKEVKLISGYDVNGTKSNESVKEEKLGQSEIFDVNKIATSLILCNDETIRNVMFYFYHFIKYESFPYIYLNYIYNKVFIHLLEFLESKLDGYLSLLGKKNPNNEFIDDFKEQVKLLIAREVLKGSFGTNKNERKEEKTKIDIMNYNASNNKDLHGKIQTYNNELVNQIKSLTEYFYKEIIEEYKINSDNLFNKVINKEFNFELFNKAGSDSLISISWGSSNLIGKKASKLLNQNNCCTVKTIKIDGEICAGSFLREDNNYFHTFWKENLASNASTPMSAGQNNNESFQMKFWNGIGNTASVICLIKDVYRGDKLYALKYNGKTAIIHCKGILSNSSCEVKIYF